MMARTQSRQMACLLLLVALAAGASSCVPAADSSDDDSFRRGRRLVCQGSFDEGIAVLGGYLEEHPGGRQASRAAFFLAKARLGQDDLEAARRGFEAVIRDYPESLEAHKSRYKLALIDFLEGRDETALIGFRSIADSPRGNPLAGESRAMARFLEQRLGEETSAGR